MTRFYDSTGNTLDNVYEIVGDVLTIWAGQKYSPAKFTGTFSTSGDEIAGDWEYPGGGGYHASMRRVS